MNMWMSASNFNFAAIVTNQINQNGGGIMRSIEKITPEEAKDLTGDVGLLVKNINRNVPAEINQELFDKVFGKDGTPKR